MSLEVKKLVKRTILQLESYKTAKSIDELKREYAFERVIKLGSNENPFGPSPLAMYAAEIALSSIGLYPDPTACRLREKISAHYKIDADQVIMGNGSAEILSLITQTFLESQDHVIIPEYSFALFNILVNAVGADCSIVPLVNWTISVDAIIKKIKPNTKLIFLANPGNPTSTRISHSQLVFLLQHIPDTTILVLDEAYIEYDCMSDKVDAIALLKNHTNLFMTRTFSKAYALAGLRIGYGIASEHLINAMNRVRLSFNLNVVAMETAMAALDDQLYLEKIISHNQREIIVLKQGLDKLSLDYLPSATNFLSIDLKTAAKPIYDQLLQRGIITRTLENYGLPTYLGVTVGLSAENNAFLQALSEII